MESKFKNQDFIIDIINRTWGKRRDEAIGTVMSGTPIELYMETICPLYYNIMLKNFSRDYHKMITKANIDKMKAKNENV